MSDKNLYTKDSIESLSPLEFTRLRPQVYAGDCTYSTQLLVEIVSNAVDEFRLGHGNKIEVSIYKDVVTVQDYGQGFLVNEKRDDGTAPVRKADYSLHPVYAAGNHESGACQDDTVAAGNDG